MKNECHKVENIMRNGKIACYTCNFSFSHNVFHSYISLVCQNAALCGNWLSLYDTIPTFNDPEKGSCENMVGKRENASNQHFSLFPQCFLPFRNHIPIFHSCLFCV